jgi:type IV pilus assembly protein PilB
LNNSHGDIRKLGFSDNNLMLFNGMISKPNGIVLITGPTGSGKSSTLSATLQHLNGDDVNIITVEDPVEYQMDGVNQIQVREEIGLTFANGLRSILRQDPDIIMIGEIRDLETAQIATRASLTGHLVLSTLHTNSAVESISRLFDMGIEPFLISSSVVGVVAQRLVRRVCRDCGEYHNLSVQEHNIFLKYNIQIDKVKRGKGCPSCNKTGYRGRLAIHEILEVNDHVKEMILNKASIAEIKKYMYTQNYRTLLEDGLLKVAEGVTTTEEILRVATDN